MMARPGGEMYGPLSVVSQSFAEVEILRRVPPSAFWPPPCVESAVVRIDPRPGRSGEALRAWGALQRLFRGRRKRLGNVLESLGLAGEAARAACVTSGAEMTARAEALSPEILERLSEYITP